MHPSRQPPACLSAYMYPYLYMFFVVVCFADASLSEGFAGSGLESGGARHAGAGVCAWRGLQPPASRWGEEKVER